MEVAKPHFTGKNWKMNEDTWGDLDTWERRDHELIRGYLKDAPEEFKNESWKLRMNNSEMMGSGESNWKDSWNAPDGWKEFSQSKIIMGGWHQARTMNLEENGARFKRNPSSVFKCWEWWWEPPWIVEIIQETEKQRGWANNENDLKSILEKHVTDGIHSYVKLRKTLGITRDK